ncbi:MAG: DNA repair protein RecN [Clostridia bacterium]|nr:DNA repair protein RecN [Clostridia bacterium]
MLASLHIENVALIKRLDIDFENGFSVLTGETGAGKSILIDSINLVCGVRTSRDIIRTGEVECFVSALFFVEDKPTLEALSELGVQPDSEDGSMMLSRRFNADGRSVCKIGTRTVPVSLLKSVATHLISMSEQHDSYSLLNSELHGDYLDRFAQASIDGFETVKKAYGNSYLLYKKAKSDLQGARIDESERRSRLDFLRFQYKELEAAKIKVGEEAQLIAERNVIRNSETVTKAIKGTSALLMGSAKPGIYDRLIMASENVEKIADVIPEGNDIVERLVTLSGQVQDVNEALLKYLPKNLDDPSAMLDKIEDRLETISSIKAKYGETEEEVIKAFEEIAQKISFLEEYEFSIKELEEAETSARKECTACEEKLRSLRIKAAELMSEQINEEFNFLDMSGVLFEVCFKPLDEFDERGGVFPEFFVKTNPGEPFKPLSAITSGGELSRIMLALMKILAGCDSIGTVVFDEIDTGVSGKTSSKIGISIKSLSREHQVICVTHSAQVSAVAHHHYKISKNEIDGRMETSVELLPDDMRVQEIARILGGVTVTEHTLETARELIAQSKNI